MLSAVGLLGVVVLGSLETDLRQRGAFAFALLRCSSSFNLADLDANGTLDKTEFKALVRYVGLGWEDARIEQTFQSIDANSDGA